MMQKVRFANPFLIQPRGLNKYFSQRMFAAKAVSAKRAANTEHQMMIPSMPLQYMVHMARVKVHLPATGDCWFFISP